MSNKYTSVYDWLKYIKANVVGINLRELRIICSCVTIPPRNMRRVSDRLTGISGASGKLLWKRYGDFTAAYLHTGKKTACRWPLMKNIFFHLKTPRFLQSISFCLYTFSLRRTQGNVIFFLLCFSFARCFRDCDNKGWNQQHCAKRRKPQWNTCLTFCADIWCGVKTNHRKRS